MLRPRHTSRRGYLLLVFILHSRLSLGALDSLLITAAAAAPLPGVALLGTDATPMIIPTTPLTSEGAGASSPSLLSPSSKSSYQLCSVASTSLRFHQLTSRRSSAFLSALLTLSTSRWLVAGWRPGSRVWMRSLQRKRSSQLRKGGVGEAASAL